MEKTDKVLAALCAEALHSGSLGESDLGQHGHASSIEFYTFCR